MTHKNLAALLLITLTTTACLRQQRVSPAALIRLTKAAQSHIAYDNTTSTDEQLLEAVYAKDPELRTEFGRFAIHTKRDGHNIVILVCSPDGRMGLLEDASWTLKVDRHWENHPCTFDPTLDPHNPTPERTPSQAAEPTSLPPGR
ncbi:MAG: hypothetical protein ABSD56_08740 [Bryobacteraceae bacterium]